MDMGRDATLRGPGGLSMPAISHVFTLARVAEMLGEDGEDIDFLHEITIEMEPQNGLIAVDGPGEEYTPALTDFGIKTIQTLIPMYRERSADSFTEGP